VVEGCGGRSSDLFACSCTCWLVLKLNHQLHPRRTYWVPTKIAISDDFSALRCCVFRVFEAFCLCSCGHPVPRPVSAPALPPTSPGDFPQRHHPARIKSQRMIYQQPALVLTPPAEARRLRGSLHICPMIAGPRPKNVAARRERRRQSIRHLDNSSSPYGVSVASSSQYLPVQCLDPTATVEGGKGARKQSTEQRRRKRPWWQRCANTDA
jgi:hypothetical protein